VLNRIIRKIPIASDYYSYYWLFPKTITGCRGIYSSFAEAMKAVPEKKSAGYNQPIVSQHHDQDQSTAQLTARSEIGTFHSIDYPIVLWLKSAFSDSSTVFDMGGNVGLAYYAYHKFLNYPNDLQWLVCELPEMVKVGKDIAIQKDSKNLSFTTDFSKAEGSEIFLTCGTLQYLEATLPELIKPLQTKPKHLLINHVPFYDGESFTTLQNIGYAYCPYKIQNRTEFINALTSLGYRLIDSWEIQRSFSIPFHPERHVPNYHGFYLRLIQE
jgi:putative methyltransferase (TIGR04325 family)